MTLAMNDLRRVGEFGVIDRIAARVAANPSVTLGIGDDAAAVRTSAGTVTLCTSDMLVEGVHFDLSLCDPVTLGRKSLAVNLSDIAAMGGIPRYFLLALALPPSLSVDFVDRFTDGLITCAEEYGVTLVGGDTCASSDKLVISITLFGEQAPQRVVARHGARVGDLVFVTGTVGDSALGLKKLRRGERSGVAVHRHLDPAPRVREGAALAAAGLATAMIDVSDGVLADLGHILARSSAKARLRLDKLPLSAEYRAELEKENDLATALSGGEDYELIFTSPPRRRNEVSALFRELGTRVTEIGEVTRGEGVELLGVDGKAQSVPKKGYDHFQREAV